MKKFMIAGALTVGMLLGSQAMAKDISAVDLLVGDFVSVGSADIQKLAANKMLENMFSDVQKSQDGVNAFVNELQSFGIDYKKDLKAITFAINEKGHFCAVLDAQKTLTDVWPKYTAKYNLTGSDYNGVTIYASTNGNETNALISDTRLVGCDGKLDLKPIIDNAKAAKPKNLKDRDKTLYNAYNATASDADIRIGGKMTKDLKTQYGQYALDGADGKKIALGDAESASLSINLSKGLKINIKAVTSNAQKATDGAAILTTNIGGMLSDPTFEQLGIGFLSKALTFSADKATLNANFTLTDDQITTLSVLLTELTKGAAPGSMNTTTTKTQKAAPAPAPAPAATK